MWNDNQLTLVRSAVALGALNVGGPLSAGEASLAKRALGSHRISKSELSGLRERLISGEDPFGEALINLRNSSTRRRLGQFLTPLTTVDSMIDWALSKGAKRIIDAGCGTGRFTQTAIQRNRKLRVLAIDIDPLSTLLSRAMVACTGAINVTVHNIDYIAFTPPRYQYKTAYVGNPPYVRHHRISQHRKGAALRIASELGHHLSSGAGLHALFFLATAKNARPGDVGCFITSSEWLDVNYGEVVRKLLLNGLGGSRICIFDPKVSHFSEAMTTAAVTCFEVGGSHETVEFSAVGNRDITILRGDSESVKVPRTLLNTEAKWSRFVRANQGKRDTMSRLGDIARVHRGAATGSNDFFVLTKQEAKDFGLTRWCRPAITSAKEIMRSGGIVRDDPDRFVVLDPPSDTDRKQHDALNEYLRKGEKNGEGRPVSSGYLASHRKPWWRVNVPNPPIVATYMARRAPVFALNPDKLGLLNIGHGIYPLQPMTEIELKALVEALNSQKETFVGFGRTYHGGLEKFEPREMEALPFQFDVASVARKILYN